MKNIFVVALLTIGFSSNSFALGAKNCSSADGQLRIIEKEIWGANPIEYGAKGNKFDREFIRLVMVSIVESTGSRTEGSQTTVERMTVMTDGPDISDLVLCSRWWNPAID